MNALAVGLIFLSVLIVVVGAVWITRRERYRDDPTELDYEAEAEAELWRLRAAFGDDGDVRHG